LSSGAPPVRSSVVTPGLAAMKSSNGIDGFSGHFLGALRAGVDVAMQAALVAAIAEVDLQRVEHAPLEGGEIGTAQQGQGGVHWGLR
jgi:hypothetical protein